MKTKVYFIIIYLFYFSSSYSQEIHSEIEPQRDAKTMRRTSLQFRSYKGERGYVGTITQYYYDMIDGRDVFTSISIYESDINDLPREFNEVFDYYIKWSLIAEKNKVPKAEKEIPVKITTIKNLGCFAYSWNADKQQVKFIFKVQDYKPYCILRISLGFQNRRYYVTDWWFSEGEVLGIIDEIKNIINKQKEFNNKKQRINDLFN